MADQWYFYKGRVPKPVPTADGNVISVRPKSWFKSHPKFVAALRGQAVPGNPPKAILDAEKAKAEAEAEAEAKKAKKAGAKAKPGKVEEKAEKSEEKAAAEAAKVAEKPSMATAIEEKKGTVKKTTTRRRRGGGS